MADEIEKLAQHLTTSPLFKAEKGGKDGDAEEDREIETGEVPKEFDKDYMKKHMKKFMESDEGREQLKKHMKENPEHAKDLLSQLHGFHKAASDAIPDNTGDATAVFFEGTDFFKATRDFNDAVLKNLTVLMAGLDNLTAGFSSLVDFQAAQGAVMVKASREIEQLAGQPPALRGVQGAAVQQQAAAAGAQQAHAEGDQAIMLKAQTTFENIGINGIKSALFKAVKDNQEKDPDFAREAGKTITQLEMSYGLLTRLPRSAIQTINRVCAAV